MDLADSGKSNGRRLDHIWLSLALAPALRTTKVQRETRGWEVLSEYGPVVVVELAV